MNYPIIPTKVFVQNINYTTTSKEIGEAFEVFGPVKQCKILTEVFHAQTLSRGKAFVDFATEDAATKAIQSSGKITIGGRNLVIKPAIQKPKIRDTVYVTGIPAGTTHQELASLFQKYGVKAMKIVQPSEGHEFGIAFVKVDTEEHHQALCEECPTIDFNGTTLKVRKAHKSFKPRRF